MTAKLVLVLGYLSLIAVTLVSWPVIRDVCTGFFRFGTVPLRAETIILERDFTLAGTTGQTVYRVRGTWEKDGKPTGDVLGHRPGRRQLAFDLRNSDKLTARAQADPRSICSTQASELATPRRFFVETEAGATALAGRRRDRRTITSGSHRAVAARFERHATIHYDACPGSRALRGSLSQPARTRRGRICGSAELWSRERAASRARLGHGGRVHRHRRGGRAEQHALLELRARQGLGHGRVGRRDPQRHRRPHDRPVAHRLRVPSRGCQPGALAAAGCVISAAISGSGSLASILGMALPCMMSLEFIRNVPVTGDRVAAMTAEGIADRYPELGWPLLDHDPRVRFPGPGSRARSACATRSPGAGPT